MKKRYLHPTQVPRSKTFGAIEWQGERIPCPNSSVRGDSFSWTWAADDDIYIGVGDPTWCELDGKVYYYGTEEFEPFKDEHECRIIGMSFDKLVGEPTAFDMKRVNDMSSYVGGGGHGPKPSGVISVNGVLYYFVQNTLGWKPPRYGVNSQHGSDATIISSADFGKTWTPDLDETISTFYKTHYIKDGDWFKPEKMWNLPAEERSNANGWTPMFPGNLFGGPSFVQFGKDNATAVDDYVYAISSDQWDNGSEIRLGRVKNDKILERESWEFAIPGDDGSVEWTASLYNSQPILAVERHLSSPEMVYLPKTKKYILATWGLHQDFAPKYGSELTILESDNPWGPFSLVYYEWMWFRQEMCCYCPRIPLKWFDEDSMSGYLLFSGSWESSGDTCYYLPQLRKFNLIPAYKKEEESK